MTGSIFDDASMVSTVVRVRDVAASVTDGPEHPIAVYTIAGAVISLWQPPANQSRVREDNDRNTYVVVVMSGDLEPARRALIDRGVDVALS